MKQRTKLSQEQHHEAAHQTQDTRSQTGREFAGTDELLRFDAAQTIVPPEVALRLKQSAAALPPRRSWWKSLLGG